MEGYSSYSGITLWAFGIDSPPRLSEHSTPIFKALIPIKAAMDVSKGFNAEYLSTQGAGRGKSKQNLGAPLGECIRQHYNTTVVDGLQFTKEISLPGFNSLTI